ncbi:MAG: COG3650 family protein [Novosphingobium sp.]
MRSLMVAGLLALAGCDKDKDESVQIVPRETAKPTVTVQSPQPNEFHRTWPAEWDGKHFRAHGNEPFWSVEVLPQAMIYSTPENTGSLIDRPRFETKGKIYRYIGTLDGKLFSLAIEHRPCSDGMSDTSYPWTVSLTIGDKTEHGCGIAE